MVEQAFKTSDNVSVNQSLPNTEAHGAAQKMLQCIQVHNQSTARDGFDKTNNDGAMTSDQQSINNVGQIKWVNTQILDLLAANKPISDDLRTKAINFHLQSRDLNNSDSSGDIAAQMKDVKDMKAEQRVINSDRWLLNDKHLSPEFRALLSQDIISKTQLEQNEKRDIADEKKYAAADDVDNKWNKAVIDALTSKTDPRQLAALLTGDNTSKDYIAAMRNADRGLEPMYSAADLRDQALNAQLNQAMKHDPYFANARRQDAGLPIWTSEDKLRQAELLQHERRRLHLSANSTSEQVREAQIVDMNKQLNLPPWATKEQRIDARKIQQDRALAGSV